MFQSQAWLGLPMAEVERAVAQHGGDIDAAVLALAGPSGLAQQQPPPEGCAALPTPGGGSLPAERGSDAGSGPRQWGSSGSDAPPAPEAPARQAPAWQLPASSTTAPQQELPRVATEQQPAAGNGGWAGANGGHAHQQQQHTPSPQPPQQQQQQWPGSGADPGSMWAVLRALQPPEEASSPTASGLPSQSDLWSCLGVPSPQPAPPKPAAPLNAPVKQRAGPPARGQRQGGPAAQQQHQGTPLQNARGHDHTPSAPTGSRLFAYTSGAGPDAPGPAAPLPDLAPCAPPALHLQPPQSGLWGGPAPAAAAAAAAVGASSGSDSAAAERPSMVQSLERYQQLLQQVPGESARSSVDSSAPSSFSGASSSQVAAGGDG